MKLTILNTSIITNTGLFKYSKISLKEAKKLVSCGFESAVGHASTAEIISTLLGVDCSMNRVQFKQETGDFGLVFKLDKRPEEGKVLSFEEIKCLGYSWGLLVKTG